jgi:hypothetical protein
VLLLTISVAGCSTSGSVERTLPARPGFAKPITVPDPRVGEDALSIAARERAGRIAANCVIVNYNEWYEALRARYAGEEFKSSATCSNRK